MTSADDKSPESSDEKRRREEAEGRKRELEELEARVDRSVAEAAGYRREAEELKGRGEEVERRKRELKARAAKVVADVEGYRSKLKELKARFERSKAEAEERRQFLIREAGLKRKRKEEAEKNEQEVEVLEGATKKRVLDDFLWKRSLENWISVLFFGLLVSTASLIVLFVGAAFLSALFCFSPTSYVCESIYVNFLHSPYKDSTLGYLPYLVLLSTLWIVSGNFNQRRGKKSSEIIKEILGRSAEKGEGQ